ncbi:MAG TPA: hypothetical protein DCW33_04135 [Proteobacteria bacterium]|nr:hypothetical protein [Pseudomonadota bacterium]
MFSRRQASKVQYSVRAICALYAVMGVGRTPFQITTRIGDDFVNLSDDQIEALHRDYVSWHRDSATPLIDTYNRQHIETTDVDSDDAPQTGLMGAATLDQHQARDAIQMLAELKDQEHLKIALGDQARVETLNRCIRSIQDEISNHQNAIAEETLINKRYSLMSASLRRYLLFTIVEKSCRYLNNLGTNHVPVAVQSAISCLPWIVACSGLTTQMEHQIPNRIKDWMVAKSKNARHLTEGMILIKDIYEACKIAMFSYRCLGFIADRVKHLCPSQICADTATSAVTSNELYAEMTICNPQGYRGIEHCYDVLTARASKP